MPIRNESAFLSRSLGSVLAQDYPHSRLEVLVADGMSTDNTRSEIARLASGSDVRVLVIENVGRIVATGLNAALLRARGEIVIRIDGHCQIAPDYVRRCVEHLSAGEGEGVGGPLETVGETPLARVIALAMSSSFGVGNSSFRTVSDRTALVDTVAFPAYTRRAIEEAGPFDEELVRNQDDEYNYRLRALGLRILLASDVRARYYSRGTFRSLARQYFQYGFWKVRVMQKHPRQMKMRQFAPPLFVAAVTFSVLLAIAGFSSRPLLLILVSYATADVIASLWVGVRRRSWWAVPGLPFVFATLHLAYGCGFLAGLLRFATRWERASRKRGPAPLPAAGAELPVPNGRGASKG